jgi:pyridoxal phosphate enzyme (YggS family)|tara:strand:- start:4638 stop:5276 length:639 start_codon:yes stop_codon:yes gene_type:complete
MNIIIERFIKIKSNINNDAVNIIAVSKTFNIDHIKPLIDFGHNHFGENKVQEASVKWSEEKSKNDKIILHMIGKLQSNKAKKAVDLFDYIHSLDNQKLAETLSKIEKTQNKKVKYFIQVNIGREKQKSGILPEELENFYNYCVNELNLNIIGLMTLPPHDKNASIYFKSLNELNMSLGLKDLSMGMSADYVEAIKFKATYLRIGSSIFGKRT